MESLQSYKQALDYIFSLRKPRENYTPGIHLERLVKFLEFVGNPHLDYDVIHVGGTSGKGSVTYLISKILIEHGLEVGTHISPYLFALNEKFQINLQNISDNELVELTNWLKSNLEAFTQNTKIELSYYESIVAMVFKHFSLSQINVAVIEVGVGGKLDATNVVNSNIAVLTNVGLDHMELLGDTKEEILKDKIEIMKTNKHFITAVKEPELLGIILEKVKLKNNKLDILDQTFHTNIKELTPAFSIFDFKNETEIKDIKLGLAGRYQIENAALAIQATYNYLGQNFDEDKMRKAFTAVSFPGRMQTISENPLIIFDGAHNESKIKALAESVNAIYPEKQVKLLFSYKKGKALDLVLKELKSFKISSIIVTEFEWEYYDRLESFKGEEIKSAFEKYTKAPIEIIVDPIIALEEASKNINSNELLLVTGSLYLIGTLLQSLLKKTNA